MTFVHSNKNHSIVSAKPSQKSTIYFEHKRAFLFSSLSSITNVFSLPPSHYPPLLLFRCALSKTETQARLGGDKTLYISETLPSTPPSPTISLWTSISSNLSASPHRLSVNATCPSINTSLSPHQHIPFSVSVRIFFCHCQRKS
jgi:hypothetical protein